MGLGIITQLRAASSAKEWGDYVKSAFDVFSPKLRAALGFTQPKSRKEEFSQWQKFSQVLCYQLPEQMPELDSQNGDDTQQEST